MLVLLFKFASYAFLTFAGVVFLVVLRHRFRQQHLWKIPGPPTPSLVWGHIYRMFNPYAYPFHEGLRQNYGRVARIYGFFGDIQLVVSDPKACNNIVVKDQTIFEETESFIEGNRQIFGPALSSTLGDQHRRQRKMLNPLFNAKHMRYMIPIFYTVARQLREKFESMLSSGPQEINIVDWMGKVAMEFIGQAGLGYSFGTLEGRNDQFCNAITELMPTASTLAVSRALFPYLHRIFHPKILKFMGQVAPWKNLNHLIKLADIMDVGDGKDIISLLMQANATASEEDRLSEEEVLAQITSLVFAATDTTSNALSRILQVLSLHPDAQDKLREELKEACEDNEELTYDRLVSLPYLEAVCRETLRLYPPVAALMRTYVTANVLMITDVLTGSSTRSDVVLPLSTPIHDANGRSIHEIFIPGDTDVFIHIYNLNRDPLIWGDDATEWKPERWLAPLPESVVEANIQGVYANTMTFVGGSRSCVGFKFSQLEMKVVLSQMIPAFRFAPSKAEIIWRFGNISSPSDLGDTYTFTNWHYGFFTTSSGVFAYDFVGCQWPSVTTTNADPTNSPDPSLPSSSATTSSTSTSPPSNSIVVNGFSYILQNPNPPSNVSSSAHIATTDVPLYNGDMYEYHAFLACSDGPSIVSVNWDEYSTPVDLTQVKCEALSSSSAKSPPTRLDELPFTFDTGDLVVCIR
ncbi:cytochrome P450 [Lactifluus subvellereus]|nr:cytochrome P450 [Lactifluus subvellereus]